MSPSRTHIPAQWRWHHRTLLRIRQTLLQHRDEHAAAACATLDRGGEDAIDRATEESEQETLRAEIRVEDAELGEVDAALERITNGTYGRCELTGRAISSARLRAIPWTRLCRQAAVQLAQRLQR